MMKEGDQSLPTEEAGDIRIFSVATMLVAEFIQGGVGTSPHGRRSGIPHVHKSHRQADALGIGNASDVCTRLRSDRECFVGEVSATRVIV